MPRKAAAKAKSAAKKMASTARRALAGRLPAATSAPKQARKTAKKKSKPAKARKSVSMEKLQSSYTDHIKSLRQQELDCCADTMNQAHTIMLNSAADPGEIAKAQTMYNELQAELQRLRAATTPAT